MKSIMKLLLLCGVMSAVQLHAYTFTFRNNTKQAVAVKMQLVGFMEKDSNSPEIAPGKEHSFAFGGLRVGLCMHSNTIALKQRGESEFKPVPVIFVAQGQYNTFIEQADRFGQIDQDLSNMSTSGLICFNQVLNIVADNAGRLYVILVGQPNII